MPRCVDMTKPTKVVGVAFPDSWTVVDNPLFPPLFYVEVEGMGELLVGRNLL